MNPTFTRQYRIFNDLQISTRYQHTDINNNGLIITRSDILNLITLLQDQAIQAGKQNWRVIVRGQVPSDTNDNDNYNDINNKNCYSLKHLNQPLEILHPDYLDPTREQAQTADNDNDDDYCLHCGLDQEDGDGDCGCVARVPNPRIMIFIKIEVTTFELFVPAAL